MSSMEMVEAVKGKADVGGDEDNDDDREWRRMEMAVARD